jgi:hypothetical protein
MSVLIDDRDFPALVGAAATAILRGQTLRDWWDSFPPVTLIELPGSTPDAFMQYFFSTLPIHDMPTTIMGCVQRSTFRRRAAAAAQPATSLPEWIANNFLRQCRWTNDDGTPGGFHYRAALVLDKSGRSLARRVDEDLELKLSDIGTRYEWAVARLDLKDYMRAFPGIVGKQSGRLQFMNREAGYMMFAPSFFSSPYPRPEG